ncbi:MAG: hypothetical protein R3D03_21505 [Geminicoccaceae bacterium]
MAAQGGRIVAEDRFDIRAAFQLVFGKACADIVDGAAPAHASQHIGKAVGWRGAALHIVTQPSGSHSARHLRAGLQPCLIRTLRGRAPRKDMAGKAALDAIACGLIQSRQ